MGGLGIWVRSEWRRTWRSLLGIALLIALGGGITIASVAGARRADSAVDRFLAEAGAAITVTAAPNLATIEPGVTGRDDTMWSDIPAEIAALPGVEGVTPAAWMAVALQADGVPGFFFTPALGPGAGSDPPTGLVVTNGRLPNPDSPTEIVLNEAASRSIGATVGDVIELRSYASDQITEFVGATGSPDRGPRIDAEVVGIVRGAEDVADNPEPTAFLSAAFRDDHRDDIAFCDCTLLVRADPAGVADVVATIASTVASRGLVVEDLHSEMRQRVDQAVNLEVGALWIASIIALGASLLIAVQAIARFIGGGRESVAALSSVGATRPEIVRSWGAIVAPATIAGAIGAAVIAIALSPLFPRGLARTAQSDDGTRVDSAAIGLGMVAIVVAAMGAALLIATTTTRRSSRPISDRQRIRVFPGWARWRPPIQLGVNLAIDPSHDRSRLAAATAIGGLAIAIGGVLAVVLIDRSTAEVLATPAAFGADWDLELLSTPDEPEAVMTATMAEPIDALGLQMTVGGTDFTVSGPGGDGLVQPFAFDQSVGTIGPLLTDGRPVSSESDAVLGTGFAAEIGAEVGDEVVINPGGHTFRVAGIGLVSDGDETDQAFVLTMDGLARLLSSGSGDFELTGAMVRTKGDDPATTERLTAIGWQPVIPPSEVANLSEIGSVPRLLAVALAALGLAGAVHTLLVATARRRGDIAVARALGFTQRQARSTIGWQAIAIVVGAIIVGVPLGLLVGRVVWKQVTEGVGAVDLVSIPWVAVVAVPSAALALVASAGWLVGRRAASLRPADVLRSE